MKCSNGSLRTMFAMGDLTVMCVMIFITSVFARVLRKSWNTNFKLLKSQWIVLCGTIICFSIMVYYILIIQQSILRNPVFVAIVIITVVSTLQIQLFYRKPEYLLTAKKLTLGTALAWCYFYGYLKIILPHIKRKMLEFSQEHKVKFEVDKLLILAPKTCMMPEKLDELNNLDNTLEFCRHLPIHTANRAGNINREYKSPVYNLKHKKSGKSQYIVVEGASNLQTLYDFKKNSKLSEEHFQQQRSLYINVVKELTRRYEYEGIYELLEYEHRMNGKAKCLSATIQNSIHELKSKLDMRSDKSDAN